MPASGTDSVPAAAIDAEVAQRLQALQDQGRISAAEAEAVLREVTLPQQTDELVRSMQDRAAARISTYPTQDQLVLGNSSVYHTREVSENAVFVLGDCAQASTDSRSWGELSESNVVGRPFLRVWPPSRFGTVEKTADLNPFRRSLEQLRREVVANLSTLQ
jgi:hypothetical protein